MISGILPNTFGHNSQAICFMIYDWSKPVGSELLTFVEQIFSEFGQVPFEGKGSCAEATSNGTYGRIKRKLATFLDNSNGDNFADIKILSEKVVDEAFFPSKLGVAWSSGSNQQRKGILSIRDELEFELDIVIQRVSKRLFELTGEAYGGVWKFPAAFGPDAYLASIQAMPKGLKWGVNKDYTDRLTRWRDNTRNLKLRARNGYFREIYPINFLVDAHLNMPFLDKPLRSFMEANGILIRLEYNDKLYRWDIPEDNLDYVREKLECSGLVLSSASKPLLIN